ncbi:MAG TPA: N-acetylmuramoyl-L-alanine amidase [Candidatus Sulfotelmatobacter sp.]|nr:N-acetylmuramoyl-L-alanine amidase [Candidatus Sulfotelmatobacter sp.]
MALTLTLAGCATAPYGEVTSVSNWQDGNVATVQVAPPPTIAPPPAPLEPVVPPPAPAPARLPAPAPAPAETWVPLSRWTTANHLAAPSRLLAGASPTFALRSAHGNLIVRPGSQSVYWQGLELRLGYAPQLIDGQPCLHSLDLRKTVQPLFQPSPRLCLSDHPTLVLDPGHGGGDAGTKSVLGNHHEKEYTLDWARRLQALLVTNGWQVFLTRTADVELALSNRVTFTEEHKADLFLSLHFNSAAPNQTEAGLETYCLTPAGMPSNLKRSFADDQALTFPNNAFDSQNLLLALQVHRALLQVNGNHDRGIRRARFPGVLRNQQRPAILVEGGYLSNPHEARLIADPAYRQKLAEAVAHALLLEPVSRPAEVARSQETEDRRPKTEGRTQKAEASIQRSEGQAPTTAIP